MHPIDATRRQLLGAGLAGSAGLALGAPAVLRAASRQSPSGRLGIAVVGLGGYARFALARLQQARIALPAALVSADADKARSWAREFGVADDAIYGYDDYTKLAADERVQAVHLCLPVGLHAPHALKAFAAGKHVLCEKPLAGSVAEAQAMQAAARAHDRVLMPAYRAWFSDAVQELRRRVREGVHGGLVSIDAHKGFAMTQPAGNWRFDPALAGAGCLTDIGLYSLQLQRWIAGGEPLRVRAMLRRDPADPRFSKVECDAHWVAEFAGGLLATGSASWRYRLQNRLQVGCSGAWLQLDPATPAIGERLRIGLDGPNRIEEPQLPLNDQVPRMYDAFAAACLGREAVPIDSEDGIADLRFVAAILAAGEPTPAA
jgi:glucose-fructose oxidoreductase